MAEPRDVALHGVTQQHDGARLRGSLLDHRRSPGTGQVLGRLLPDERALGSWEVAVVSPDGGCVRPFAPESVEEVQLRALVGRLHDTWVLFDEPEPPGGARLLRPEDDEVRGAGSPSWGTLWIVGQHLEDTAALPHAGRVLRLRSARGRGVQSQARRTVRSRIGIGNLSRDSAWSASMIAPFHPSLPGLGRSQRACGACAFYGAAPPMTG